MPRFAILLVALVSLGRIAVAQQGPALHVLASTPTQFGTSLLADAAVNSPAPQQADPPEQPPLRDQGMWAGNPTKFFTGALGAFVGHESGHLIANWALGTDPYLMGIHNGPIPFFTIQPGKPLTNRQHYITASAGFNAENLIDEWLLTAHPRLSQEDKPLLKGIASFNFWCNVGYAASAFAQTGPDERDTKGMADSLGWNEAWVGALILVPTALDTYRYKHPDSKWAPTASRISKLAMIFLAAAAQD